MIGICEALEIILLESENYGIERVPLMDSIGRSLAEDITTDRDSPPFDRVMMDGIAIQLGALENDISAAYPIQGIQAAGFPRMTLQDKQHCLEVMTGAILPVNTDTVIPYEEIRIENGIAYVKLDKVQKRYVHYRGSDSLNGSQILSKGKKLNPGDIGILATVGKVMVKVFKHPKVAVISTGDELVNVDEVPEKHQIRKSNVHSIAAGLAKDGIKADIYHIPDNKKTLFQRLGNIIQNYNVVLLSGGVSKGKYDHIPEVLDNLGVEKLFHRVAQKPGKPFWFGKHEALQTKIFAFPGNPVSTFVGYHYYFRQWLYHSLGSKLLISRRPLAMALPASPNLSLFISARLNTETGEAVPLSNNGSGDLFSLAQTEGFLLLHKREGEYLKGELFDYIEF